MLLYYTYIPTPLGILLAIADNTHLHLLHYNDTVVTKQFIKKHIAWLRLTPQKNNILEQVAYEVNQYFAGLLTRFSIPLKIVVPTFSADVLHRTQTVGFGQTQSYSEIARQMGKTDAQRAVGQALAHNTILIIIPCHRIVAVHDSSIGYNAGIPRKIWLLTHENRQ